MSSVPVNSSSTLPAQIYTSVTFLQVKHAFNAVVPAVSNTQLAGNNLIVVAHRIEQNGYIKILSGYRP